MCYELVTEDVQKQEMSQQACPPCTTMKGLQIKTFLARCSTKALIIIFLENTIMDPEHSVQALTSQDFVPLACLIVIFENCK